MNRIVFVVIVAAALAVVACTDRPEPTAPNLPPAISATGRGPSAAAMSAGSGSSICLVNQKALADLDGQLQDNPDDEGLKVQYEAQAAITADICE